MNKKLRTAKEATETQTGGIRFIGSRAAEEKTANSRWTLWRLEQQGAFPRSMRIGGKRFWVADEVESWMQARVAERG